jgi:hypothetical protein
MAETAICPKCFKRGVLKQKDGKLVYEHNFMYADPETSRVEFKFTYCPADSPDTEEQK